MHAYELLLLMMFFSSVLENTSTLPDLLSMPMLAINLCAPKSFCLCRGVSSYRTPAPLGKNIAIIIPGIHIETVRGSQQVFIKT